MCQPKTNGGLGLRQARDSHLAMLSSNYMKGRIGQIFRKKSLKGFCTSRTLSATWRGLLKTRESLKRGLRWRIGNGTRVGPGSKPLIELATREVPLQFRSWTVSDVMDENGGWNLALLQDLLPAECLEEIRATPTSEIARREDSVSWGLSSNGMF